MIKESVAHEKELLFMPGPFIIIVLYIENCIDMMKLLYTPEINPMLDFFVISLVNNISTLINS